MAHIALVKIITKILEKNATSWEAGEDNLKDEHAKTVVFSTQVGKGSDRAGGQILQWLEKLAAKDALV